MTATILPFHLPGSNPAGEATSPPLVDVTVLAQRRDRQTVTSVPSPSPLLGEGEHADHLNNALVLIEDALDALADADTNLGTEVRTCGDINRARAAGRIQAAIWAAQEHLQPHLPQDGAA